MDKKWIRKATASTIRASQHLTHEEYAEALDAMREAEDALDTAIHALIEEQEEKRG